MATTPLRKCNAAGCKTLIREGSRCEKHARTQYVGTLKNKAGDPFYSSTTWMKVRNQRRLMNPLCQQCEAKGLVVAMHAVDHIRARREYPELAYEIDNTQSLCEHCHNSVKQREERARC